ncbi:MAG: CBS domain-containing protein [Erysipelotrichaceae bacterium]|nr:CBS domain-containing protein [Erysipelotrichaceae bacterium]
MAETAGVKTEENKNMDYSTEYNEIFLRKYRELENIEPNLYASLKKHYREEFETFRTLRNSLTHDEVEGHYPFAVSKDVVDYIDAILEIATTKVIDLCTPLDALVTVKLNTTIREAVSIMDITGFSYLPILDKNKRVIAVVSEKGIISYLAEGNISPDDTVNDFKRYFLIDNGKEKFSFLAASDNLDSARKTFERNKNTKRCELIFLTKNGDPEEAVLGILTPHDVL